MSNNGRIQIQGLNPFLAASLREHLACSDEFLANGCDILITGDLTLAQRCCMECPQADVFFCTEKTDAGTPDGVAAFFAMPFRLGRLLSRIHDALEIKDRQRARNLDLGGWQFRPREKSLIGSNGEVVRLTDKETALLVYLEAHPSGASRAELLASVWSYSDRVTTHTLETHIWRLRQKIESDPAAPAILLTSGDGYRLKTGDGLA